MIVPQTIQPVEIAITDLAIDMIIGVRPHERTARQKIILELYITYDAASAVTSGSMNDVIDYWQLSKDITHWLTTTSYFLLETLLADLLTYLMKDARVAICRVTIHKPEALKVFGADVSLSGTRKRAPEAN